MAVNFFSTLGLTLTFAQGSSRKAIASLFSLSFLTHYTAAAVSFTHGTSSRFSPFLDFVRKQLSLTHTTLNIAQHSKLFRRDKEGRDVCRLDFSSETQWAGTSEGTAQGTWLTTPIAFTFFSFSRAVSFFRRTHSLWRLKRKGKKENQIFYKLLVRRSLKRIKTKSTGWRHCSSPRHFL